MDLIEKALNIAIKAHKGAVDKGGADYVFHPVTVALRCRTDDEKIVALLHDVVEDTPATLGDLREAGFPERIVEAVDAVTRREGEERASYLARCKANPIARAVKIADLKHNSELERIPAQSEAFRRKVSEQYPAEIKFLES